MATTLRVLFTRDRGEPWFELTGDKASGKLNPEPLSFVVGRDVSRYYLAKIDTPAILMAAIHEVSFPAGPGEGRYWVNATPLTIDDWPPSGGTPAPLPLASGGIKTELDILGPGST